MAFKIDKLKTKYKNSALCLSEKLASFYTQRFIHKTVRQHIQKAMNWTEYREQLIKNIDVLSLERRLDFAIEICERLLPDYKAFYNEYKWGNLDSLTDGLVLCKQNANGLDTDVKSIERLISLIEEITPDTEDFGEVSGSLALNSASAIIETLNFILDNKTERITDIGSFSYDSAFFKAGELNPKLSDAEVENEIELQNEVAWQLEKTKYVA